MYLHFLNIVEIHREEINRVEIHKFEHGGILKRGNGNIPSGNSQYDQT